MIKNEIDCGHVYYFEPNDALLGKDQDGVDIALTPHLEDLCVAMTLTADIYPRDKECIYTLDEQNKQQSVKRSLSWISYVNGGDTSISKQVVNQGVNMGGDNYLTTYYSEISADKYVENELVEGLGVTNVNISFESWYTPTITVSFVDVNGSALWGREEAIHDDGEITSDNILGVFFTQPYPLFRLQVKGFLGHDVTYQLSVSNFKGKYNSQTGNFEATATFIGYSYSLLTDIPLRMLAVVPELSYVGKEYWNSHANSPEWSMINADGTRTPPIKLWKLIHKIRSAQQSLGTQKNSKDCEGNKQETSKTTEADPTAKDKIVSQEDAAQKARIYLVIEELKKVEVAYQKLFNSCMVGCAVSVRGEEQGLNKKNKEEVLMLFENATQKQYSQIVISTNYKSLCEAINDYNTNCTIQNYKIINDIETNYKEFHQWAYHLTVANQTWVKILTDNVPINNVNFEDITVENQKLFKNTASKLKELCETETETDVPSYAKLIPLGTISSQITLIKAASAKISSNVETKIGQIIAQSSNSSELIELKKNLKDGESIEVSNKRKIIEYLGFEPTIGNFVKMLMCHLETFVEVMMECGDRIYSDLSLRLPEKYGIDLNDDTDISNRNKSPKSTREAPNKPIWPWPALYNPSPENNSETSVNPSVKYETLGWTNDYPPLNDGVEWEEQKVILSFLNAMERYEEDTNLRNKEMSNTFITLPLTPTDLFNKSPFANVAKSFKNVGELAPYLGLRIANVLGIADGTAYAREIGYLDALNLVSVNDNPKLLKKLTKDTFANDVIAYLTCKKSICQTEGGNEEYNKFETIKPNSGHKLSGDRHRMFSESNTEVYTYTYTYFYTSFYKNADELSYISIVPTDIYEFTGQNNPYSKTITPIYKESDGTQELTFKPKINYSKSKSVEQNFAYDCKTKDIIDEKYLDTYTNNRLFYVSTDITGNNNFWQRVKDIRDSQTKIGTYSVNNDTFKNYTSRYIKHTYNDVKDVTSLICLNPVVFTHPLSKKKEQNDYYKEHLLPTTTQIYDAQWVTKLQEQYIDEKDLKDVIIGELPIYIGDSPCSLFGSRFYYLQNNITDNKLRDKAKAYLLLSSMMSEQTKVVGLNMSVEFRVEMYPPFYAYFLGAILWRSRQTTEPLYMDNYKSNNLNNTFLVKGDDSKKGGEFKIVAQNANISYKPITDYIGSLETIDIAVQNRLILLFENFAYSNDFAIIKKYSELKNSDNAVINGAVFDELKTKWSDNGFQSSSPSEWSNIFNVRYKNKYSSIIYQDDGTVKGENLRLLYSEDNKAMDILRTLFGLKGGFIVGHCSQDDSKRQITVTTNAMSNYLEGFKECIKSVLDSTKTESKKKDGITASEVDRDYAVSFYYSLKHLWDTWLITSARNQFTIENFFNKSFVFIDSFYVNTYNTIKLNADKIVDAYNAQSANLLTFISNVTSKEGCMMFALPSFFDSNVLGGYDSTIQNYQKHNDDMRWKKENLRKMFTPLSFNEMGAPQVNNTFVFIYTHQFSDNALENTDKRFDSYMMNDSAHWPGVLKQPNIIGATSDRDLNENDLNITVRPNNGMPDESDDLISARYAYVMPCFGVAINRGNNQIFTSINVNMDTPKTTAVSAQTWEDILTKTGADKSKRIFFHGQDIYSIYSQYAYACEIEMIGCVQIQPLMYFQLLNIPMWRGTYMIYKVVHSMAPGTMTTKFVGMKMSRKQTPYATGYFTVAKETTEKDDTSKNETQQKDVTPETNLNAQEDPEENHNEVIEVTEVSQTQTNNEDESSKDEDGSTSEGTNPVGGNAMLNNVFKNTGTHYISSPYGVARPGHLHGGTDIAGKPEGTPLYAPWDCKVIYVGFQARGAGNYVDFIDNTNKVKVRYFHCKTILAQQNKRYKKGEQLAELGNTGLSTGPHLHIELYVDGRRVNPMERHGVI